MHNSVGLWVFCCVRERQLQGTHPPQPGKCWPDTFATVDREIGESGHCFVCHGGNGFHG